MNTALYFLRATQLGLSIDDLDQMNYSFVVDMMIESGNDTVQDEYEKVATQNDFDRF